MYMLHMSHNFKLHKYLYYSSLNNIPNEYTFEVFKLFCPHENACKYSINYKHLFKFILNGKS